LCLWHNFHSAFLRVTGVKLTAYISMRKPKNKEGELKLIFPSLPLGR